MKTLVHCYTRVLLANVSPVTVSSYCLSVYSFIIYVVSGADVFWENKAQIYLFLCYRHLSLQCFLLRRCVDSICMTFVFKNVCKLDTFSY